MMGIEITSGLLFGSLGLVSDAIHLGVNCFGVALSLVAISFSQKSTSLEATFGFERSHVLAAFSNAVFLVFVSVFILLEAFARIWQEDDFHHHHHAGTFLAMV
jgi:cation diffusion facilitator family transporter